MRNKWVPNAWTCRDCGAETATYYQPSTRFSAEYDAYYETGLCETCDSLYHRDEEEIFNGDPAGEVI